MGLTRNHRLGGPTCLAGLGQATADVELVCMRFTNKKIKIKKNKIKTTTSEVTGADVDLFFHHCAYIHFMLF
jgi:hypothetical protein